jgi:hypothetical protein
MNILARHPRVAFGLLALLTAASAQATEGGGSTYPRGLENFMVGAAPPPGFYFMLYGNAYEATKQKDNNGHTVPIPGFKVSEQSLSLRGIWSTPVQVGGGNLMFHTVIPLVNLKVEAAGASQTKTGVGDISVGAGVALHHSQNLHSVYALDVVLPTGDYNKNDLANIGRNYVSFEPLYAITYLDPNGFNADAKFVLNINRRNSDTGYRSGTELFVDYALGWGFGNGWTAGVSGDIWRQLDNDRQYGASISGNKVRSFAIGPSIRYQAKNWFITAKVQKEFGVHNSTQGTALWIKATIPF